MSERLTIDDLASFDRLRDAILGPEWEGVPSRVRMDVVKALTRLVNEVNRHHNADRALGREMTRMTDIKALEIVARVKEVYTGVLDADGLAETVARIARETRGSLANEREKRMDRVLEMAERVLKHLEPRVEVIK